MNCNPTLFILAQITPIYEALTGILSRILEIQINDTAINITVDALAAGSTQIRQIKQLCNLPSVKLRGADMTTVRISSGWRHRRLKHPKKNQQWRADDFH